MLSSHFTGSARLEWQEHPPTLGWVELLNTHAYSGFTGVKQTDCVCEWASGARAPADMMWCLTSLAQRTMVAHAVLGQNVRLKVLNQLRETTGRATTWTGNPRRQPSGTRWELEQEKRSNTPVWAWNRPEKQARRAHCVSELSNHTVEGSIQWIICSVNAQFSTVSNHIIKGK